MPNHLDAIVVITHDAGRVDAAGRGVDAARRGEAFANARSDRELPGSSVSRRHDHNDLANASPLQRPALAAGSLGAIIGNFKSTTARRINLLRNTAGASVWQRGYHDHIIRNERELDAIRAYILANPSRWALDIDNPIHSLKSAPRRTVDDYLRDAYLL